MRRYSARKSNLSKWTMAGTYVLVWLVGMILFLTTNDAAPRGLRAVTPTLTAIQLDVSTLAPCPGEYGPAVRDPRAACVWDATSMGVSMGINPVRGAYVRWLVYLPACPVSTVQNPALVVCVPMDHWGE